MIHSHSAKNQWIQDVSISLNNFTSNLNAYSLNYLGFNTFQLLNRNILNH